MCFPSASQDINCVVSIILLSASEFKVILSSIFGKGFIKIHVRHMGRKYDYVACDYIVYCNLSLQLVVIYPNKKVILLTLVA